VAAIHNTCTKHSNSTLCNADDANNCQWVAALGDSGLCISNPNDMWQELLVCPGSVVSAELCKDCTVDGQLEHIASLADGRLLAGAARS
jgi:hypothetical protein